MYASPRIGLINTFYEHGLINFTEEILFQNKKISIAQYIKNGIFQEEDYGSICLLSDAILQYFKDDQDFKNSCTEYIVRQFSREPRSIPRSLFRFLDYDLVDINEHNLFILTLNAFSIDPEKGRYKLKDSSYTIDLSSILEKFNDSTRDYFFDSKINNITLSDFILAEMDINEAINILAKYKLPATAISFTEKRLVALLEESELLMPDNLNVLWTCFFKQLCFDMHTQDSLKDALKNNEQLRKNFCNWLMDNNVQIKHKENLKTPLLVILSSQGSFSFLYPHFLPNKKDIYLKSVEEKIVELKSSDLEGDEFLTAHQEILQKIEDFYQHNLINLHEEIGQGRTLLDYVVETIKWVNVTDYTAEKLEKINTIKEIKQAYIFGIQREINYDLEHPEIKTLEKIIKCTKYKIIDANTVITYAINRGKRKNTFNIHLLSFLINKVATLGGTFQELKIKNDACDAIKTIFARNFLKHISSQGIQLLKNLDENNYEPYFTPEPHLILKYPKFSCILLSLTIFLIYKKLDYIRNIGHKTYDTLATLVV